MNRFLTLAFLFILFLFSLTVFSGLGDIIRAEEKSGSAIAENVVAAENDGDFLTPTELAAAKTKFQITITSFFKGKIYPIAVLLLLIFSGLSKQIYLLVSRISTRYFFRLPLFVILFLLIFMALKIPLLIWDAGIAEKVYGYKWTWGNLLRPLLNEWGLLSIVGIIAAFIFFPLLRKKPKTWWIWSSIVVSILAFAFINISPLLSSSGGKGLKVMPESELKNKLEVILVKAGRPDIPIYILETSNTGRNKTPNGRVMGIPPKVILWDIDNTSDDEVEFLFAHELSHYIYRHVFIMIPIALIILGIGLPVSGRVVKWMAARYSKRTGFSESWEIPAFPAWLMMILCISFISVPVQFYPMWFIENHADRNGARLSGKPLAGAKMYADTIRLLKIYPDPPKYLYVWHDPHPPLGTRVRQLLDIAGKEQNDIMPERAPRREEH